MELVFERKNMLIDKGNFLFSRVTGRRKLIMHIFEKIAEGKIKEAIAKGEFDNLPGKGKPLDLSDYFQTSAQYRIIYDFLKKAGFLPQEVELLKQISHLKERRKSCNDSEKLESIDKEINDKTTELNILKERYLKTRL